VADTLDCAVQLNASRAPGGAPLLASELESVGAGRFAVLYDEALGPAAVGV